MIEELLLTNYDKKKIAILKILNQRIGRQTNINTLVESLTLSYQGVITLLEEMQHELSLVFGITLCEKGFKLIPFTDEVCEKRYLKYLIEHTLAFQLILTSLTQPQVTLEEFAAQQYISRSTVNRGLKKLKEYLNERNIHLNVSKIKLSGNEIDIRLFLVHILLLIDPSRLEMLFRDFRKEAGILISLGQKHLSITHQHVVFIMFITSRLRYTQGYKIEEVKGFDDIYEPLDSELDDYLYRFIHDDQQFLYHKNYLKGLIFFLFHYTDRSSIQDNIIDHFSENIKECQPLFRQLINELTDSILHNFFEKDLKAKKIYEIKRIIFLIFYLTYAINGHYINLWLQNEFYHLSHQKHYERLEKDIRKIINKYSRRVGYEWLNNGKAHLPSYLAFFLFPYYQNVRMKKLRIGLLPTLDFTVIQQLSFFLEHVDFIEYGIANDSENVFDFYLSDSRKSPQQINDAKIIQFQKTKIEDISPLFEILWDKYLKKNRK
ncbi:helix-turn-helix domain-containing protein [Enterococcus sp. N342-3-1-2]